MSGKPRRRVVAVLFAITACICGAVAIWGGGTRPNPPVPRDFPIPGFRTTSFLNTGSDARFVGSDVCATCHRDNHRTYLMTEHSRALSEADPKSEPPDATYHHAASGRTYRVSRENGRLRHEESIRTDNATISSTAFEMKYLVGSGHFSRTYVLELDGFLYESPITWYASRGKWDMSPGYDGERHGGFERPVLDTCLYCHAGRVEPVDGAAHRLRITEQAIGCESCHGPGSLHVDRSRGNPVPAVPDPTIVNPGRLPRSLQEDVCATCHLTGASAVMLRGRSMGDFRPGAPLSDYRMHYRMEGVGDEMAVTGHVEQMRLSRCHQNSEMTCLTCHDPHQREKPKDPVAAQRAICMSCHGTKPCTLAPADRLAKDGTDNCAGCHMPRGGTDIPHLAFTHHRIGRHGKPAAPSARSPRLVPIESEEHLPAAERERNLALAHLEAAASPSLPPQSASDFRAAGLKWLREAYDSGMRDPEAMRHLMDAAEPRRRSELAAEILAIPSAPANARASALMTLARIETEASDFAAARARLVEHNRILRSAGSLHMQGVASLMLGDAEQAVSPLKSAAMLRPERAATQEALAEAHRLLLQPTDEKRHRAAFERLRKSGRE